MISINKTKNYARKILVKTVEVKKWLEVISAVGLVTKMKDTVL
jgi:hypothetical protein